MRTLLRFGWREAIRLRARLLLIAFVLAAQSAALGGGVVCRDSLAFTRDLWASRLHLADLVVHFTPAAAREMPPLAELARLPGVLAIDRRYVALGYVEHLSGESRSPLPVVVHYLDPGVHPTVDDVAVVRGRWLERGRPDLAVIDRSLARDVSIGATIIIDPQRLASRFQVAGIGLSAEHLVPTANPEVLVPHRGSLGIVYASREALDRVFPDELYDELVVRLSPGANRSVTTAALLAALRDLDVERVSTGEESFGARFTDIMLEGTRSVTPTIALVIALMAAIVAFVTAHRLVAERRREIGCLLAQGFSATEVAGCFVALGLVSGIAGALLGVPAALLFARIVATTSASVSGFPDPIMLARPFPLAIAATSAIVVGALSFVPASLRLLRATPIEAVRGVGEIRFSGLPAVLERLLGGTVAGRYALRNIFRRVPVSLATITLVAISIGLPAGLLTTVSSWHSWAEGEAARLPWDAVVSFKVPLSEARVLESMAAAGVVEWDAYVQGYATISRGRSTELARVRGVAAAGQLGRPCLSAGASFSADDADEAILEAGFSHGRPPVIGEVVTVLHRSRVHRLRVVGIVTQGTLATVLVPRETARRIFGLEGKVSGAFVRFGPGAPARAASTTPASTPPASTAEAIERLDIDVTPAAAADGRVREPASALVDDELVANVELRREFAAATAAYLSSFVAVVVPFIGLSGILAFFFVLGVIDFMVVEREPELATLRSMGYRGGEIAWTILVELGILAAVGLVLSLGAWGALAAIFRAPMARAWFWIPLDPRAQDFAICAAPTCLVLLAAAAGGIRRVLRSDLALVLRRRAIG